MKDDAELLRQYVEQRSDAAFAEIVERHVALVYSTALRELAGDTHLAEDAAQIVFTSLARKAASLSDRVTLAGWLYLSAHHAAAQLVRSEQRRRAREQKADTMNELYPAMESDGDWAQLRPVLDEAMKALSDADREAVLLRYFERRPFSDIGALFSLSEDAARMRVDRALDKLRVLLGRRGITSTSAALGIALANQAVVAAPVGLAVTVTGAALSSVAATTTAASAALSTGILMTKTTMTVSLVALIAIGSAIYFHNQTQRAEAAAMSADREREALRTKLVDAERRTAQAESQSVSLKRDLAGGFSNKPAPVNAAVVSGAAGIPSSAVSSNGAVMEFRAMPASTDKAEALRRVREINGRSMESAYASLFRQLKFTPEQIEQFKNAKLDAQEKGEQLFKNEVAAARAENPTLDRAAMQKIFEKITAEKSAEAQVALRDGFGAAAFAEIQSFESTMPVRPMATQLANALFYSDAPLTATQADQLVEMMAAQSRRNPRGYVDAGTMNAVAVLEAAQAVLSPAQLTAFRQIVSDRVRTQLDQERSLDETKAAKPPAASLKKSGG